jgi:hypothetical protein
MKEEIEKTKKQIASEQLKLKERQDQLLEKDEEVKGVGVGSVGVSGGRQQKGNSQRQRPQNAGSREAEYDEETDSGAEQEHEMYMHKKSPEGGSDAPASYNPAAAAALS